MVSDVTLVCRAKEVIEEERCRVVEIDTYDEYGATTFRFKVRHWSYEVRGKLFTFKEGTLLIVIGRLINDEKGETVIVAEKIQYLNDGSKELKNL
jgi:hypothetical protein